MSDRVCKTSDPLIIYYVIFGPRQNSNHNCECSKNTRAQLTQADLTQGRVDSGADLTSGRVDPLQYTSLLKQYFGWGPEFVRLGKSLKPTIIASFSYNSFKRLANWSL